jgi:hypothetical protein
LASLFSNNKDDKSKKTQENAQKIQDMMDRYNVRSRDLSVPEGSRKEASPADLAWQGYSFINQYTDVSNSRGTRYQDYKDMCRVPELNQGLNIYADNGSQFDIGGNVLKIVSNNGKIVDILENLFFKNLDMNSNLWPIFRNMCKLGDEFQETVLDNPDPEKAKHVISLERIKKPENMYRNETDGNLLSFKYEFDDKDTPAKEFKPWQITHFLIDDEEFHPYGKSIFESGRKTYKRLSLMEDAMLIYRISRAPERRVFYIDVGNLPTKEANKYIEQLKRQFRKKKFINNNGDIDEQANPIETLDDFFIPVRQNSQGTRIETLPEGRAMSEIDDVKYFRDQILRMMGIPSGYLGGAVGDSGAAYDPKSYLSNQEIQFSRTIERVQKFVIRGLEKIAYIELALNKIDPKEARDFKIVLTPASNVDQLMEIEILNQKFALIAQIKANQGFLPDEWIYKQILGFSDKEVQKVRLQLQMEAQTAIQAGGQSGGSGGGGFGGGGNIAGDMNSPEPEAGGDATTPPEAPAAGGAPAAPAPSLDVASNQIEFNGYKFLVESEDNLKKFLKYLTLYEKVTKDNLKEDYSKQNSLTRMLIEGEFRGLFTVEIKGKALTEQTQ